MRGATKRCRASRGNTAPSMTVSCEPPRRPRVLLEFLARNSHFTRMRFQIRRYWPGEKSRRMSSSAASREMRAAAYQRETHHRETHIPLPCGCRCARQRSDERQEDVAPIAITLPVHDCFSLSRSGHARQSDCGRQIRQVEHCRGVRGALRNWEWRMAPTRYAPRRGASCRSANKTTTRKAYS
jgi:hypothetical protein